MLRSAASWLNLPLPVLMLVMLTGCDQSARNADMTPPPMGPEPASPPATEEAASLPKSRGGAQPDTGSIPVDVVSAENPEQKLGTATLLDMDAGLTVRFEIAANNVISAGEHAIHIHENGSCNSMDTDDDGTPDAAGAAGGHFNPANVGHGQEAGPHAGDSEAYNYTFNDDGSFTAEVVFTEATLTGEHAVQKEGGTAIVIHEGADDKESDPAGNSGPRIACAIIPPAQAVVRPM